VQVITGARVERWMLDMTTTVSPRAVTRRNTDLLPALSVNVKVNTAHALRLSASQTLARPEYRELSATGYRDFIGGFDVFGNDTLQRTLIRNYDARWEWYPNPGEVLSLGVFAKDFDGPIEKVITGSTGGDALTFVNASGGRSYGVELEIRKNLLTLIPALAPFSVFGNATLMHSRIEPGSANLTNAERPMVGQAPYVVNVGITYTAPRGSVSATVLYNVVGRRVYEAGSYPRPDAYEEARNLVDVSIQAQLFDRLTAKLDGKNLLDDPIHVTQGAVTRLRYTTGRVFSLGLTWQP
jgi:TonB-dependent receptor